MKTVAIKEVVLADNGPLTNRGSRWLVTVDGRPVANFATLAAAQKRAAKLAA